MDELILEKWKVLINACKAYYIDSIPTGLSDSEFDELESRAIQEDNFYARDYVLEKYMKGTKTLNLYIDKIKKTKVQGMSMIDALEKFQNSTTEELYFDLKYDGSSLAIYLDPSTGIPKNIVTVGNTNLNSYGVDQTWKLLKFLPKRFPKGIVAIQAEALINLDDIPESEKPRARQKANGLINSKNCDQEVKQYLTIRCYRYYCDNSPEGVKISGLNYREVLKMINTQVLNNRIVFSPADSWTIGELKAMPGFCENIRTRTSTGEFLNDGWVIYNSAGVCLGAFKFAGAGSESDGVIKSTVKSIQWNDQTSKGKDSWSANVIIEPVIINGTKITKPSAGSVNKLINNEISPGAVVKIILANSTIPMVGDCISAGNGDYMFPECSCGHKLSEDDVYGSNLKCGNTLCINRISRMRDYINSLDNINDLDLNKLLVIDRFDWGTTGIDIPKLLETVIKNSETDYYNILSSYMTTELRKRNLDLVWKASWITLRESYENTKRN
jgi:NAD-dependent DNA ligase